MEAILDALCHEIPPENRFCGPIGERGDVVSYVPAKTELCLVIPAYKPNQNLSALVGEAGRLLAQDFEIKVVIVDDGSGDEYLNVFEAFTTDDRVTVLRHAVNKGKGAALKTALNYIMTNINCIGAVTMDADGQHLPKDVLAVAQCLSAHKTSLILGCRSFTGHRIPWRSRFGNKLTSMIIRFMLGRRFSDTQTGLRGIPRMFMPDILTLKTSGYDLEMEMLSLAVSQVSILEVPISTVYTDGKNSESHFHPLLDSLAIYLVLLRHIANSLVTASIDFAVFSLIYLGGGTVLTSLICGRIIAVVFNFHVGKKHVFKSSGSYHFELLQFSMLVILLVTMSYCGIIGLGRVGVSAITAKIIVESLLFGLSFSIQRSVVFSTRQRLR